MRHTLKVKDNQMCIIATSIVHSNVDKNNSFSYNPS